MSEEPGGQEPAASVPSEEELRRITAYIYRWTGMIFGESKRYYIERRLAHRIAKTNMPDVRAYLALLAGSAVEREQLVNAFTVNETYFYREEHQFAALSAQILPQVIANKRPGDLVRIWSMPCSTGDEAYSIAIWLLENWPLVDAYNVEIVGSDVDTAAIEQAKAGRYAPRALARLPATVIASYFEAERNHRRKIIDDLRESVRFVPANLFDRSTLPSLGKFDIILCRNMLIYFDDESRRIAADNLFDCLHPGGFLLLGHSESMARITDRFTMVRLDDAIVYRRP
ncbi:protein-glutamate O-methyltransferase CheR [Sphingomonas sp. BIUV-7]|uniref:protein-glutamate O-methyltransferase n=1 Tax=Sphingomonas natans TaxID=3063330 RepID=A0ABT8YG02_9SPHN|nr:protein-glutamate O-methyltransferase CheR [Sphingomonas sp. BIUV-7]MDO6416715.1 protein-glutamate O-methyltransferase CheR [Sphingomonas sp. BIUV-7]